MLDALDCRLACAALPAAAPGPAALSTRELSVSAGARPILRRVHLEVPARQVTALIGPSGSGKTTLLKCFNRLIDLAPGLTVEGEVLLDGRSVFAPGVDPDELRSRVGILFQQPVVFPGSVYDNVLFGLKRSGRAHRREWPERARAALEEAALWREVADRLASPAGRLSTGQQQRLCLARALALEPEVLLMDEPTSALDPRSSEAIEELIARLKRRHTIVLVTHNLGQARRVADRVACLCLRDGAGELLECAPSVDLFGRPRCREVVEYLGTSLAEEALALGFAAPARPSTEEEVACRR